MFLHFNFWILFHCFWDLDFLNLGYYFSDSLEKIWFHMLFQDCPEDIIASKDSWVEQLAETAYTVAWIDFKRRQKTGNGTLKQTNRATCEKLNTRQNKQRTTPVRH